VVGLLYGSREIALGCISKACRAHGWPLDLSSAAGANYSYVPVVSQERLAGAQLPLCWAGLDRCAYLREVLRRVLSGAEVCLAMQNLAAGDAANLTWEAAGVH
jgi:hypothetical protein